VSAVLFHRFYEFYGRLTRLFALVAGIIFFLIMVVVTVNAVARSFFDMPIEGTLEVTEIMMPFAIMFPMAFTQARGAHIRVTLIVGRLSPAVGRLSYSVALLLGACFFAWATWATAGTALRSYALNEHAYTGKLAIPIYPGKIAIAFSLLLLSIQFLLDHMRVGWLRAYGKHDELGEDQEYGAFQ